MFYVDLFRELEKFEVRYLLVGGVAVNLHGIGRLTADIDLMLALDAGNLSKFVSVGDVLGLKPIVPIALADVADAAKVKGWIEQKGMLALALRPPDITAPTLDILVKPVVPFEEAYERRVDRSLGGAIVTVASIEDIIRLKTGTGRQKDEADIAALRQILRMERASYAV